MPIRKQVDVRPDWKTKAHDIGFTWHTDDKGVTYWVDDAYWAFSTREIDEIEVATELCYGLVLDAVDTVIADRALLEKFGYNDAAIRLIRHSWDTRGHNPTVDNTFYTRFDFAYENGVPKLLEVNGDTPTSLLEGAAMQWFWMEDRFANADQFNSIHDGLVGYFTKLHNSGVSHAHVCCISPHPEDEGTVSYVEEVMRQGGMDTSFIALDRIGLRSDGYFVDESERVITHMFKLVPTEWMLESDFGTALVDAIITGKLTLMEPAWKMVASNKMLLETLYQQNPNNPHILRASTSEHDLSGYAKVKKPVLGREGQNVTITDAYGGVVETNGGYYDDDQYIYQQRTTLLNANGRHAVIGSWIIDGEAAGMGIRESANLITNNVSQFVPHVIEG